MFSEINKNLVNKWNTLKFSPRRVLPEEAVKGHSVPEVRYFKSLPPGSAEAYGVYEIKNGRLYTDRLFSISVMSNSGLVPGASWQYKNGRFLKPHENSVFYKGVPLSPKKIEGCVFSLLTGGGGNDNYFHWLYDVLTRLAILKYSDYMDEIDFYLVPELGREFQVSTLEWLGIPKDKIISSLDYRHIRASKLVVTEHPFPDRIFPWAVRWLSSSYKIKAAVQKEKRIYIRRDDSSKYRRLVNEGELLDILSGFGFSSYSLSELTFKEQVKLFSGADVVLGVHGAGFANITFCRRGAKAVEIFNPRFVQDMYKQISEAAGVSYYRVMGKDAGPDAAENVANIYADISNIKEMLK